MRNDSPVLTFCKGNDDFLGKWEAGGVSDKERELDSQTWVCILTAPSSSMTVGK